MPHQHCSPLNIYALVIQRRCFHFVGTEFESRVLQKPCGQHIGELVIEGFIQDKEITPKLIILGIHAGDHQPYEVMAVDSSKE